MTLRDFDPAFSDDLRRELVSRADDARAPAAPPLLHRPQVRVTIVTAVVLVAATIGVLRLVPPHPSPARPAPATSAPDAAVVDPLAAISASTDPAVFVSRHPRVLLHERGDGEEQQAYAFDVPEDVTDVRVVTSCSDGGHVSWSVPRFAFSGGCIPDAVAASDVRVQPGSRVTLDWSVTGASGSGIVVAAIPAAAKDPWGVIDPVRDLVARGDAVVPLLRRSGTGTEALDLAAAGTDRVRVYFACTPGSKAAAVTVDGHRHAGCANSIDGAFDVTVGRSTVSARVDAPDDLPWELLVVAAS